MHCIQTLSQLLSVGARFKVCYLGLRVVRIKQKKEPCGSYPNTAQFTNTEGTRFTFSAIKSKADPKRINQKEPAAYFYSPLSCNGNVQHPFGLPPAKPPSSSSHFLILVLYSIAGMYS